MVKELSNEEIVTNLLTEKAILQPCKINSFVQNSGKKLSDFLADANELASAKKLKYSFIKDGLWKF